MVCNEKRTVRNSISTTGHAIGILLISGGVVLFVDNLGIFPFAVTRLFWPIVLLFYGLVLLKASKSAFTLVWGITALLASFLLLLNAFEVLHITLKILWPLALIACGVILLIYRTQWPLGMPEYSGTLDHLHEFAVFSGSKRKVESPNFEGGEVSAVFGEIKIDLRRARISSSAREAVIEANAAFGGIEIRVPEDWRVSLQGTAVFGAYEDKSLPPRPEPGMASPLLIVRGGVAFGGVSIQN